MARKIALLIGVSDYGAGLKPLRCPAQGVKAMAAVLSRPDIGEFDQIIELVNPGVGEMRSRISALFAQLTQHDLILFYFTGHGIKDMTGDFYLTTSESELFPNGRPNAGTAVEADFLRRELGNCLAQRKVIVLDCCFGAAFADGFLAMNDSSVDVEAHLGGKGWCLLTASTSARYALEQEGEALSVYTRYLVEGLKTGGAAPDGQPVISARHWHEYVKAQVKVAAPVMEPAMFNGQQGYEIIIARAAVNPAQRYRKQVQAKVHGDGYIGPAGRAVLAQWRSRLNLSQAEAAAIEAEILQPYRERKKHLQVYARAASAEKQLGYPLRAAAIAELKELQRLLGLRDRDVSSIEQQLLGQAIATGQQDSPQIQLSVLPSKGAPTCKERPASRSSFSFQTFTFQTLEVNAQGEIIYRRRGEATRYVEDLGQGVTLEMVRVPGGQFLMGAPPAEEGAEEGASEGEFPQQVVHLPDFWMGRFPVTRAQWQAAQRPPCPDASLLTCPGNCPMDNKAIASGSGQVDSRESHPIENIFWPDAVDFCQWLSARTGRRYQLPSAAQWEYACRAGTTSPFSFGPTLTPDLANYNGNYAYGRGPKGLYRQRTTPVGQFPPNGFGLSDMHGNVWEWCLDGWPADWPAENSLGASSSKLSGQRKTLRGGSWSYQPTNCRSAYRLTYPFHGRIDDVGFRVVYLGNPPFSSRPSQLQARDIAAVGRKNS